MINLPQPDGAGLTGSSTRRDVHRAVRAQGSEVIAAALGGGLRGRGSG